MCNRGGGIYNSLKKPEKPEPPYQTATDGNLWTDFAADQFPNEFDVDGTSEDTAYEISNAAELALLAKRVNEENAKYGALYYKLTNDIFLAPHNWQPIGIDSNVPFTGNFNGQGHTIYGMNIDDVNVVYGGLFGNFAFGTIKNLKLRDGQLSSSTTTGSLIGMAISTTAATISNVTSNVKVSGNGEYTGGLIGYCFGVSISNCSYTGYVNGKQNVGGLVGMIGPGLTGYTDVTASVSTLTNCTTDCYVSGDSNVGLLAGANGGTISNCMGKGTIDGQGNILVGSNKGMNFFLLKEVNGNMSACSFYGSATHDDLTLPLGATACWAVVNERRLLSSDLEDPSWTENWAVVDGMNNGLPMQKGLFWIASAIETPLDKLKQSLNGFEVGVS